MTVFGRLAAVGAVAAVVALRPDLIVRAIRALDRRAGLASSIGTGLYARHAHRFTRPLREHVVEEVVDRLAARDEVVVVDVGSGPGDLVLDLARALPRARIVGVDPSGDMLRHARDAATAAGLGDRVEFLEAAAERLPFAAASVDVAVSTLASHHWPDPAAALAELARVLRPGGEARIHDVRFAAFGPCELADLGRRAGIPNGSLERRVCEVRLGPIRPFAVATLRR